MHTQKNKKKERKKKTLTKPTIKEIEKNTNHGPKIAIVDSLHCGSNDNVYKLRLPALLLFPITTVLTFHHLSTRSSTSINNNYSSIMTPTTISIIIKHHPQQQQSLAASDQTNFCKSSSFAASPCTALPSQHGQQSLAILLVHLHIYPMHQHCHFWSQMFQSRSSQLLRFTKVNFKP